MKKLIVIDDEELIRNKIVSLLDWNRLGIEIVAQAKDGLDGEKLILLHRPDLVITDVVMSGQTGLEMIASLKDRVETKFIVLSGYQDFFFVQEALRLGAADYVLKPVQSAELENTLLTVMGDIPQEPDYKRYGNIVANVLTLVLSELSNPELSLKNLCSNYLFMNETYVSRLFQKKVGMKFTMYVTNCRIEKAQQLLISQPELSIGEVATKVGFASDGKYFSEVFKRVTGIGPSKYRSDR